MFSRVHSCVVIGVDGCPVQVEVDITRGLPVFSTVGLPDGAVKESRERVKAAIKNCGYEFPAKRIVVNLAPADIRKEGTVLDLPIAMGILLSSGAFEIRREGKFCFCGELSLDGSVHRVPGILPMIEAAEQRKFEGIFIPEANIEEVRVWSGEVTIYPIRRLQQAAEFLAGGELVKLKEVKKDFNQSIIGKEEADFTEIKGQEHAKRALEIASAGGHNVLLVGPPGSGKTMLAKRFPTILPEMTREELLETSKIFSVSHKIPPTKRTITSRPFRSPHHTISDAGLIGGGNIPQPGEVSLAHNGVLFLDELPEFKKSVLEVLRQPMEDGVVTIARANMTLTFPARFLLIAAMNPCPCGYLGDKQNRCNCSTADIKRYRGKISGPLLDRIDMQVEAAALEYSDMTETKSGESSNDIKKRVDRARSTQRDRFGSLPHIYCNGQMNNRLIKEFCEIDSKSSRMLEKSTNKLGFSARAYHRVLKLSRTIADLDHSGRVQLPHLAEAIQLCRITD